MSTVVILSVTSLLLCFALAPVIVRKMNWRKDKYYTALLLWGVALGVSTYMSDEVGTLAPVYVVDACFATVIANGTIESIQRSDISLSFLTGVLNWDRRTVYEQAFDGDATWDEALRRDSKKLQEDWDRIVADLQ